MQLKMKFKGGKTWADMRALLSEKAFDFSGLHNGSADLCACELANA